MRAEGDVPDEIVASLRSAGEAGQATMPTVEAEVDSLVAFRRRNRMLPVGVYFSAGTLVWTAGGAMEIETIQVGARVLTADCNRPSGRTVPTTAGRGRPNRSLDSHAPERVCSAHLVE